MNLCMNGQSLFMKMSFRKQRLCAVLTFTYAHEIAMMRGILMSEGITCLH